MKLHFIVIIACIILPFFAMAQIDTIPNKPVDTTIKTTVDTTAKSTKAKPEAHGFAIGLKFGLNYNKISGLELTEGYKPGYHFGLFAEIGKRAIGFQPEILFSQAGTRISNDTASEFEADEKVKLSYLQIPVLLRWTIGKTLIFNVGPQFGLLLNKGDIVLENGKEAFKGSDFAMDFGVQLRVGNLRFYGRYNIGLSDISDLEDQENWKNQVFQIGLGIKVY